MGRRGAIARKSLEMEKAGKQAIAGIPEPTQQSQPPSPSLRPGTNLGGRRAVRPALPGSSLRMMPPRLARMALLGRKPPSPAGPTAHELAEARDRERFLAMISDSRAASGREALRGDEELLTLAALEDRAREEYLAVVIRIAAEESQLRGLALLASSEGDAARGAGEGLLPEARSPTTVVTDTVNASGAEWTLPGWLLRALASALWDQTIRV